MIQFKIRAYQLPLTQPYAWAKGIQTERRGFIVTCNINGIEGYGEIAPPPHQPIDPTAWHEHIQTTLNQLQPQNDIPQALDAIGCTDRIRSGIAGAWLDAQARIHQMPLANYIAQRLGLTTTPATTIPVNALIPAVDPDTCATLATQAIANGFTTLKIKCDGDPRNDAPRLTAIRNAVGPDISLRLDANESWNPRHALRHIHDLESFNLQYIEQPIPATQTDALVDLCRNSPTPIALDESTTHWNAIQPYLDAGTRPHLILKPQRLGGIDTTAQLIQQATHASLTCTVTNSLETAIGRSHALHAAALLPPPIPACGLATETFLASDVTPHAPRTRDGQQHLPDQPGIGITPLEGDWQ